MTVTERLRSAVSHAEPDPPSSADSRVVTVAVVAIAISAFCFAFQETSLLTALRTIEKTLPGATTSTVSLLESGYLVVAAVSSPALGKIGDRSGQKPVLLLAMAMYMVGAVGAALTPDFAALVIFRAVQGVGGAIFALALAIVRPLAGDRLPVAIGSIVGGFGAGITAGFASSGVITAQLGWRWLFGIEALLIVLAMMLIVRFVPDPSQPSGADRDLPGVATLGLGIGSLLLALTFGPNFGWTSAPVLLLFSMVPVLLGGWWWWEHRVPEPLLDTGVLSQPNILFPNLAGALAGYAAFSTYLLVPRLAQSPTRGPTAGYGLGFTLTDIGLLMMPIGLGTLTGSTFGGALSRRVGGKWPFVAGMVLLAAGPALLAEVRPATWVIGLWLYLTGLGFGVSVGAAGTLVIQAAPPEATATATSLNTLSRLVGGGIGTQVGTIILISGRYPHSQLSDLFSYRLAFLLAAGAAAAGALFAAATRASRTSGA